MDIQKKHFLVRASEQLLMLFLTQKQEKSLKKSTYQLPHFAKKSFH